MSDPPTDASSSRLPAWLSSGRLRWWLLGALALIVLVRAVLPWGLARVAESQGSKQMGRIVQVGNVDLGLVMGRIAVDDVLVGPLLARVEDPKAPIDPDRVLLSFERLGVDLSWTKLLTGELRLSEVSLDSPRAQIIRDENGELVPIRVAPPAPEEEEQKLAEGEPSEPGPPLPIAIDTLRLSGIELLLLSLARERAPVALEMEGLALEDFRLERGNLTLGSLNLQSPSVTLLRDASFGTRFQGAEQEAEEAAEVSEEAGEEEPGTPPAVHIARFELRQAKFSVVVGEETLVATLAVSANDVSLEEGERFELEVDLGIAPGEITLAGQAGVIPPSFAGTLAWKGLELGPLLRAAVPDAPLSIASGASEGTLEIGALLAGKPEHGKSHLTLSGRAAVTGLDAREAQDQLALAWQGVEVGIDRIHALLPSPDAPAPVPEIALASLKVTAPHVKVKRSAATAPAAAPEAAAAPEEEAAAGEASQPRITLARLDVSGGVFELDDATVSPAHRSEYRDITVQASDLHWPDAAFGSLEVSLLGPRASQIALQGALQHAAGDLEIDVKELPLPGYSSYAAQAAGYRLEAGTFSYDAEASIEGQTVTLDSDVKLRHLDVAEVRSGTFTEQFGMSLDVALALLRDPFGGIHLPVNGSFGPEPGGGVSLAPIMLGALRQALLGAMTTPIKGLGLLIPGGGERDDGMLLEPVAFAPGALEPSSDSQLSGLAKLLEARPGLALVLRGRSNSEDDRYLATEMLAEAAANGSELPSVGAAKAGFFERRRAVGALKDHAKGDGQALAELEGEDAERLARWVAQVEVPESRREELARTRASKLSDRLVGERGVDAERVRVGDPLAGEPAVVIDLAPAG
jgi:hypothetical protein